MATRRLQAAPITPKAPCLVEVDRYKQLMIKQRDIMMALTHRLNERDETILALQAEVSSSGTPPSARECPPPPRLHRSEHHFFGVAKPSPLGFRLEHPMFFRWRRSHAQKSARRWTRAVTSALEVRDSATSGATILICLILPVTIVVLGCSFN